MLAKLTGAKQLTLPDELLTSFPGVDSFNVSEEGGRIVLTPVRSNRLGAPKAGGAEHHGGGCAGCGGVGEATRHRRPAPLLLA